MSTPRTVADRYGNLWRYYSDVGWVQLVTRPASEQPALDRDDLEAQFGPTTPVWTYA